MFEMQERNGVNVFVGELVFVSGSGFNFVSLKLLQINKNLEKITTEVFFNIK